MSFVLVRSQVLCVRGCRKLWQKHSVDVGEESKKIENIAEDCALVEENCRCP